MNLKASPQLVAALLSQMVSDANVGISGDANCSMFVAFRVDAIPAAGTVMAMGVETGSHTGMRLRVLTNNSVDLMISGIGSVPIVTQDLISGGWNTLGAVKASGSSPYLVYFNGSFINGGGTGVGNFTDAPVRYGVNAAGAERFEGEVSYSVMTSSALSAAEMLALHKAALAALPTSSVVCAYKMDELTQGKFRDLSKNANHLTASNVCMIGGQVPGGVRGRVKYSDPLQIPGALCVYDAALGVTKDGSDRVSQWNDLSDNASHMVQATGALQPLWVANGINNLPALRLTNAGAEFMASTSGVFRGARRAHTLVAVVKMHAAPTSTYAGFFALGSGGAGGNTSCVGHDNANKLWYGGAGYGTPILPKTATNGETYIMVKRSNGRQDTMYLNNVRFESVPQALNYTITPIADILFGKYTAVYSSPNILASFLGAWNRELSDAEVRGLINHLGEKYGVFTPVDRSLASGRATAGSRSLAS